MIAADLEKKYSDLLGDVRFDSLERLLSQPNIFEILRVTHYEIRHSNFLAWLLNPEGTHGFGNSFLTKFLRDAFRRRHPDSKLSITEAGELARGKVYVYREWNNIDIMIEFSDLVIVIENKVWSGERDEQLMNYKKTVETSFPDHRHFFVFLTPYGQQASMPATYISYSYAGVVSILEKLLQVNDSSLNNNSKTYIKDYINSIKRHIMGNSEANELARRVYYSHKHLFDFIFANRPDAVQEIQQALIRKLKSLDHVIGSPGPGFVRFLSKDLDSLIPRDGGPRGWAKGESFLFEVALNYETDRKLRIYCTLPPDPCGSKAAIKKGLDAAFGKQDDHVGWIAYYDKQVSYEPVVIASKGTESIDAFIASIWPQIEEMIGKAEAQLIPLLTKEATNA